MEMNKPELKPCPFCGGEATMKSTITLFPNNGKEVVFVECINGCAMGKIVPESVKYCAAQIAAQNWNRRK